MESRHFYLEADAMHATTERKKKHKHVYCTTVSFHIQMARKKALTINCFHKQFFRLL